MVLANITRLLAKERQGSFDLLSKNGEDQTSNRDNRDELSKHQSY